MGKDPLLLNKDAQKQDRNPEKLFFLRLKPINLTRK